MEQEFEISGTQLVKYRGLSSDVVIPDVVTSIGENAFRSCSTIKSLTLPESLEEIDSAFANCESLLQVEIPERVKSIDTGAFSGCTSLTEAIINADIYVIPPSMFKGCTSLTTVELNTKIQTICYSAFRDCTRLKEINLPMELRKIERKAFSGCTSLNFIDIPICVKAIGIEAFEGCTNLKHATLNSKLIEIYKRAFPLDTVIKLIDKEHYNLSGDIPEVIKNLHLRIDEENPTTTICFFSPSYSAANAIADIIEHIKKGGTQRKFLLCIVHYTDGKELEVGEIRKVSDFMSSYIPNSNRRVMSIIDRVDQVKALLDMGLS